MESIPGLHNRLQIRALIILVPSVLAPSILEADNRTFHVHVDIKKQK
jgi:hypothetical protein